MGTTWVVVAHRAGARIMEHKTSDKSLELVSTLEHAESRLKSGALESDRPGDTFSSGPGPGRHPMGHEHGAHDRTAENFARQLAAVLATGRNEKRFRELVLVAEPRFLGMLRAKLDDHTAALVSECLHKDLAKLSVHELRKPLSAVVAL